MILSDNLLVFTDHPDAHAPNRLVEEAKKMGHGVEKIAYSEADFNDLPTARSVILREPNIDPKNYALRDRILDHYSSNNCTILNANSYKKWPVLDKITQHKEFLEAGIPHIKLLDLKTPDYPFIVKSKLGSHGSHVFKINNQSDLDRVLEKGYKKEDLLIQEFQNSGFDLRVIALSGKVLGAMKRTPKTDEFLSNYSQGGTVEKYEIEMEIENIALKAASHFKLDFVGVDIMKGNDSKWKVLEVNRACQFKGFEASTGVNVAKEIVNFVLGN